MKHFPLKPLSAVLVAVTALALTPAADAGSLTGPGKPKVIYTWVNGQRVARLTPGSTSDRASDYALGVSGEINAAGAYIQSVDPGSPAERVGLEVGDVLLAVNGIGITSLDDWMRAVAGSTFARLRIRNVRDPFGPPVFRDVRLR